MSGDLESDDEEKREEIAVRDTESAGPSADVTGNTQMSLVNAGFIGTNRSFSEGVSVGDAPIFIGHMTGVKKLSTRRSILRTRQMYTRNVR